MVELGAGTGLGGLCAAAVGAHVLLTDVPSVVWGMLQGNIERNRIRDPCNVQTCTDSESCRADTSAVKTVSNKGDARHASSSEDATDMATTTAACIHSDATPRAASVAAIDTSSTNNVCDVGCVDARIHDVDSPAKPVCSDDIDSLPWPTSVGVGRGSAAAVSLDWTRPIVAEGGVDPRECDVIIAAECVWLAGGCHARRFHVCFARIILTHMLID